MEKLSCKDLMLGDWIKMNNGYAKVTAIDTHKIYFLDKLGTGIAYCAEPIPLTAEILEKNGFESYSHESNLIWGIKTAEGHWVLAYMDYYWSFTMDCTIYRRIKIQYVHELQHTLKICNIDKEIVL